MRNKNIIVLAILSVLIFFGCKRTQDEIFDKSPSVRMDEAITHIYSVLRANPNGWIIRYFPHPEQEFGGYSLFAKFTSDAEVSLTSDINLSTIKSSYAVVPEGGPILTFNSYNKVIHYFSEPGVDSGNGANDTGMGGDFEFIVLEATEKGIVLKGKKSGNTILMEPMDATGQAVHDSYIEFAAFFDNQTYFLFENKAGDIEDVNLGQRTFQLPEDLNGPLITFRVVPDGLDLYKETEIRGVKVKKLKYVAPSAQYLKGYFTDENSTFKFIPQPPPLNILFRDNVWATSYKNIGPIGQGFWDGAKIKLTQAGYTVDNFYVGTISGFQGLFWSLQRGAVFGGVTINIIPVFGTTDQVRITFDGRIVGNITGAMWSSGLNDFFSPFSSRVFKITNSSGTENPKELLLQDVVNQNNWFKFFVDDIDDPFNN